MPESDKEVENRLSKKLDEISRRLLGEPSKEELSVMQMQLDAIQKWDEIHRTFAAVSDDIDTTEVHHHHIE
jgi:hypothetical protein